MTATHSLMGLPCLCKVGYKGMLCAFSPLRLRVLARASPHFHNACADRDMHTMGMATGGCPTFMGSCQLLLKSLQVCQLLPALHTLCFALLC